MTNSVSLPPARRRVVLPVTFFNDRASRDLPMPVVLSVTAKGFSVAADDPALPDYLSDAEYYSSIVYMSGERSWLGLQSSARASAKRLRAVLESVPAETFEVEVEVEVEQ